MTVSQPDLRRILAKLRCPICAAPVEVRDGAGRCVAAGHPLRLGGDRRPSRRGVGGDWLFEHPALLRAKLALLNRLNPLPCVLDPWTEEREVLDLGCGPWQYLYAPERTRLHVGLDRSARTLRAAAHRYPASVHLVASLEDPLPVATKSFDTTLLLFVLHHLPAAVVSRLVEEAVRVTREHLVVLDHTVSDVPWQRAIQRAYWNAADGGYCYRSETQWAEVWSGLRVVEHRRLGRLFRSVCLYRLVV